LRSNSESRHQTAVCRIQCSWAVCSR